MKIELTFLDGLFIDILEKGNIDQETIKLIIEFIKTHQYDTESFRMDLNAYNDIKQSNLYNISNQNMEFLSDSKQFITNFDCMFYTIFKGVII